jgi:ATP-dependent protease Clp ATPase subunit
MSEKVLCHWCRKAACEVELMFEGRQEISICSECIEVMHEMLQDHRSTSGAQRIPDASGSPPANPDM